MLVVEYLVCSLSAQFVCVEIYDGVIVVQYCVDCWGASCLFSQFVIEARGDCKLYGRTDELLRMSEFLSYFL